MVAVAADALVSLPPPIKNSPTANARRAAISNTAEYLALILVLNLFLLLFVFFVE